MKKTSTINVEISWFDGKNNLFVVSEGEGRTHLIRFDRYSFEWIKIRHHREENLEAAIDTEGEYHPHVSDGWDDDPYTWWDFSDDAVVEARGVVHGEVSHKYPLPLEAVLVAADDWGIEHLGAAQLGMEIG